MKSINFVILGDYQIITELGKKGTTSDISIYDKKTLDTIYTWTAPVGFPEKIQPLMQGVNMAEYAILNIARLDRYLGEQIIALDSVGFTDGYILHSYEVDEEKLRMLIKNTSISVFKILDNIDQLKREIAVLEPKSLELQESNRNNKSVVIPIDHAFDVKGIGTVVLGVLKQGTIKVYDKLKLMPSGRDIVIKSIQMHDDPVQESKSPARVGLAIKGVTNEEISRGDILCSSVNNVMNVATPGNLLSAHFKKNSYYQSDILENQTYMASVGLQVKPIKIKRNENSNDSVIRIIPDKSIVYIPGQTFAVLKPDNQGIRIIGQGTLLG